MMPNMPDASAEDRDPANWDAAIVEHPRPELKIPQVSLSRGNGDDIISVTVREGEIINLAITHFVSMGLLNLGFSEDTPSPSEMWSSFSRQAEAHGCNVFYIPRDNQIDVLQQMDKPCGVFAVTDYLGGLIIRRCQRLNLHVPGELFVISSGNGPRCLKWTPPLSSIDIPYDTMGLDAMKLCLDMLAGKPVKSIEYSPSGLIIRESAKIMNKDLNTASDIAQYLKRNLAYTVQLEDLVRHSRYSAQHLSKIFSAAYGTSPIAYLKDLRLKKAKSMLVSGDVKVMDIAETCGYRDANHLCRTFRERVGVTPRAFAKTHRNNESSHN